MVAPAQWPTEDATPQTATARPSRLANLQAELAVLGGMVIDPTAIDRAVEVLPDPGMFSHPAHAAVYRAIIAIHQQVKPVDEVTLIAELQRAGDFEKVGGVPFLSQLQDFTPTSANIAFHAEEVRERFVQRRLREQAAGIVHLAETYTGPVAELQDQAEETIFAVGKQGARRTGLEVVKPGLWTLFEQIERWQAAPGLAGLSCGVPEVDRFTGGLSDDDFVIVAARPSMGKSAWADCWALHLAVNKGQPVAYFSVENGKQKKILNWICIEARVDSTRVRGGRLDDYELARLAEAAGRINIAPIYIDDTPGLTIMEMRAKARRLKAEVPNLAAIFVDYLQLMKAAGFEGQPTQEVSEISRGLKTINRELRTPVIALSQLSRATESRPDKRPTMADLRQSGAIEQDADVIMFLYRPEYYYGAMDKEGNNLEGKGEVIVAKQRMGKTGTAHVQFLKEFTRWEPRMEGA